MTVRVRVKEDSIEVHGAGDASGMVIRLGLKGVAESDRRKIPKCDNWYRIKFNCDQGRIFDLLHAMKDVEIVD